MEGACRKCNNHKNHLDLREKQDPNIGSTAEQAASSRAAVNIRSSTVYDRESYFTACLLGECIASPLPC